LRVTVPIDVADTLAAEEYTELKLKHLHPEAGPYWKPKDLSEWGMSYLSRLGECAFSKLTGLPLNMNYAEYDGGIDFRHNGITIDVKTICKRKDPEDKALLVYADKLNGTNGKRPLKAHVLVLNEVFEDQNQVVTYGWCTLARFKRECHEVDKGFGPTYQLDERDLSAFRDLWMVLFELQVADF
jgi:hypothetical protein